MQAYSTLMMETMYSSETSVDFQRTTLHCVMSQKAALFNINSVPFFIYSRADLSAQRPITESARTYVNKSSSMATQDKKQTSKRARNKNKNAK
jgi:hypothetical protein